MRPRLFSTAALIAVCCLCAFVAACGSSSSSSTGKSGTTTTASKPLKVDYANITSAAELFKELNNDVIAAGKTLGYKVKTYDNNFNPQTALSNAQLMAADHPDSIFEFNGVAGAAASLEAVFTRAGIPCVSVNTPGAGNCHWFNLDNATVCGDSGKALGRAASDRGWTGDDTTVILVQAALAGPETNTCMGYFYQQVQELVPGLEKIKDYTDITTTTTHIGDSAIQVDGSGALAPSFKAVSNALSSIPATRHLILYTVQDDSALGGWQAIQRAGRAKQAITAGLGGETAALQQLRTNPAWIAEGDVFITELGEYMMAMARAIDDGADIPFLTTVPEAVLTKDMTVPGTSIVPLSTYFKEGANAPFKLPPLQPVTTKRLGTLGIKSAGNDYLAKTGVLQRFGNVMDLK